MLTSPFLGVPTDLQLIAYRLRLCHYQLRTRLILLGEQDANDPKRGLLARIKEFLWLLPKQSLFLLPVWLFLVLNPLSASAGIFTVVADFFALPVTKMTASVSNSQNMALLEVATTGGPEVPSEIVSGGALLAMAVPTDSPASSGAGFPSTDQISVYVVRPGDTVSQIADMYDVSVNTILWANDLKKGQALQTGQTLVILPINGIRHTVAKGETLASVAKKYGGDADEIRSFNGLEPGAKLAVGDEIIIPDGDMPGQTAGTKIAGSKNRTVSGGGGPSLDGYFKWPVAGGKRSQGLHGHNGIDIAAPSGTAVLAAAPGTVILSKSSGYNGGYGQYIVVKHSNGTQTLYAHLSANNVSSGESVDRGDVIGAVGSTGKSTGNHLHIEVRGAKNPF